MRFRRLGRTGFSVSEIGYGMWGLAGWTGSNDDETARALDRAVALGCNFFDTAWGYGAGKSERILGEIVRAHPDRELFVATKLPPKNFTWPSRKGFTLDECYPPDHIREYAEKSLANLGLPHIDLLQFHVWEDSWAHDARWQKAMSQLKDEKLVRAIGVSVNRWEPENVIATIKTGLIDAVQVIYNIFDQAPQDLLLPVCAEREIGVIARVPFDEGSLTGTLTHETRWPEGDWRNTYFVPENLRASVDRADRLKPLVPAGMTLPELALRWILEDARIATIIPGMRKIRHVEANMSVSAGTSLSTDLMKELKGHRWDRIPTEWSQ